LHRCALVVVKPRRSRWKSSDLCAAHHSGDARIRAITVQQ
jgi:hypothetical protein